MSVTVTDIQEKVAATVDQTTTPPTSGGTEWNVRLEYINRAQEEWANAYDWDALRVHYWTPVTGLSQVTVTLPSNFRKMAGYPLNHSSGVSGGEEWPEIQPAEVKMYSTTDKYYYILGNRSAGYNMIWSPGTLASGASLLIQYYAYPTTLTIGTSSSPISDPEYLAERTIAYILESRSDGRFQEIESKAREKLLLMLDNENAKSVAYRNQILTQERKYYNFRLGRD